MTISLPLQREPQPSRSRTLAEYAVAETGMGLVDHKEHKNLFASEVIYTHYKDVKTAGIILEDKINGITKFAEPIGVIGGIVPVTNPTSTTIFKALLALKTRNGIVFFPHPRAKKCTVRAARLVMEAAVRRRSAPRDHRLDRGSDY